MIRKFGVTKTEEWVLAYLQGKNWTSPTEIGGAYGDFKHGQFHYKSGYHSAWGSPRCKSLVEKGYLERNNNGYYRLKFR